MKVARGAYPFLVVPLLAAAIAGVFHWTWSVVPLSAFSAALYFFRDPERHGPWATTSIFSPADGKVVAIAPVQRPMGLEELTTRIAIYLSPWDVHVNRSPIAGKVHRIQYIRGRFFPAFLSKAMSQNESNWILIGNESFKIFVRQIAGSLARRIVCYRKEGDPVLQGERLGIIRLGSCVELYLPQDVQIQVKVGDRVKAGASIVANRVNR